MRNLLFVLAGLFVAVWVLGLRGDFPIAGNVHLLLVLGVIAAILGIYEHRSLLKSKMNEENQ